MNGTQTETRHWIRVAQCRVVMAAKPGSPRCTVEDHVVARSGRATPWRWLGAADVVWLSEADGPGLDEVFTELPGCAVAVGPGLRPRVRLRGVQGDLVVEDPVEARTLASVAHAWRASGEVLENLDRAMAADWSGPVSQMGEPPAFAASVRFRGLTALCRWTVRV